MGDRLRNAASRIGLAALFVGAVTAVIAPPARADNLLGLYVGAGVGRSHARNDLSALSDVNGFVEHHTGWKALIGVRPISLVGAEIEYADFGHPAEFGVTAWPFNALTYNVDVAQKATSLFGLVYWPLPLPILDVYGKAGLSRLQTEVNASWRCAAPVVCGANPFYHQDSTDTRFAYGAGAQAKFLGLAVRAEYERISAPGGNPDLLSLIATWTF